MKERADSEKVSPTAYATGYLWYRHGLSHRGLLIPEGKRIDRAFRLLIGTIRLFGGMSVDALMLARHKGIDAVLARDVEAGRVTQVLELAAGLSPRGWRFTQRFGDKLTYVETDLPFMADLKRRLLTDAKLLGPRHRVATVNALTDAGTDSLQEAVRALDPKAGLAIITEGLLSYLDPPTAQAVWRRIAAALRGFPYGVYLSDAYVRQDRYGVGMRLFRRAIETRVRGRMHIHFETADEAATALRAAGFRDVRLHEPASLPETRDLAKIRGGDRVRILQAVA